jgi:hypothetical protein
MKTRSISPMTRTVTLLHSLNLEAMARPATPPPAMIKSKLFEAASCALAVMLRFKRFFGAVADAKMEWRKRSPEADSSDLGEKDEPYPHNLHNPHRNLLKRSITANAQDAASKSFDFIIGLW